MPTTIYDSSLITQRQKVKAESESFINRIQNPTNPNTGYAPALGIYDQSIINSVNMGQMKFYRKNDGGCTNISNGCPCPDINSSNDIIPPSEVPFINVRYGSVIVSYGQPERGTQPFTYVVVGKSKGNPTVTSEQTTELEYTFASDAFVAGQEYQFSVAAYNAAGGSKAETVTLTAAPYGSPELTAVLNSDTPGSIILSLESAPFPLAPTSEYNIITYLNNVELPESIWRPVPSMLLPAQIIMNNLQGSQTYSFKIQVRNNSNTISSYSNKTQPIVTLASGPQGISWAALSPTSVRVSYNNFSTQAGGFNLIGGAAQVTNGYSLFLNTTKLTNTSVDIIGLTPGTTYYDFTLQFASPPLLSLVSAIPTFTTPLDSNYAIYLH